MTDEEWNRLSGQMQAAWPAHEFTDAQRRSYRQGLDGEDPMILVAVVDQLRAEGRADLPPIGMMRTRARALGARLAPAPAGAPAANTPPAPPAPPVVARAGASAPASEAWRERDNLLVLGAALVVLLSCFMPWITTPWFSRSGVDTGDGSMVLALSLIGLGLVVITGRPFAFGLSQVAVAALVLFVVIYDMNEIGGVAGEEFGALVSIGFGLYLALVGALAWVVLAGRVALLARQRATASAA